MINSVNPFIHSTLEPQAPTVNCLSDLTHREPCSLANIVNKLPALSLTVRDLVPGSASLLFIPAVLEFQWQQPVLTHYNQTESFFICCLYHFSCRYINKNSKKEFQRWQASQSQPIFQISWIVESKGGWIRNWKQMCLALFQIDINGKWIVVW